MASNKNDKSPNRIILPGRSTKPIRDSVPHHVMRPDEPPTEGSDQSDSGSDSNQGDNGGSDGESDSQND